MLILPTIEEVQKKLNAHSQGHLLDFYKELSELDQAKLLGNLSQFDVERVNSIFKTATTSTPDALKQQLSPLPADALDSTITATPEKIEHWRNAGLTLIGQGKAAVILLAGGQGTRLGSSEPKGCYNIQLPSKKSLFQLQGERIVRLQQIAQAHVKSTTPVILPWYVMTSGPTRADTEAFFIKNNYFGLKKENVFFFNQGVLPAFTPEGMIFLESKTSPAFSPDGNGGIYAALRSEGVIADLEKRGIPYVHVYCVDNCLVKVADPVFLGYCLEKGADCGCKVVPKTKPSESVGVICLKGGKPAVVEYSEFDKTLSEERDAKGELVYRAANIANHFFTVDFLRKIKEFEGKLEYHIAKKKIKHITADGSLVAPTSTNGIKLELFIFDVLPFAEKFVVLETPRKEEFSPLKNAPGSKDGDSPETSRADIISQHIRYVESAGGKVSGSTGETLPEFEISPLFSYDGEGLEILKGVTVPTPKILASVSDIEALVHENK